MLTMKMLTMDHKFVFGTALAVSTGLAAYSTYKYWSLHRTKQSENVYETQKSLHDYLNFHFGKDEDVLEWEFGPRESLDFPKRCAELCIKYSTKTEAVPNRALDIGCGVGRSSFELTRSFDEVVGIDYSHSFIEACNDLKAKGRLKYSVQTEGELERECEAVIDPSLDRSKLVFRQGDACALSSDLGQFGCVLAANLICRLHTPKGFLRRLGSLVAPGGCLVITSPYTFSTEFTPRDNWIGGYITTDGQELSAFEGMKQILSPSFDLLAEENMPFFIRETAHKNQWTVAHTTVWRRKT